MSCIPYIFVGFTGLLVWLQACDYTCLVQDVTAHNGSFVVCVVFIVTLLLHALLNRLIATNPKKPFLLTLSVLASIFFIAYLTCDNEAIRILFLCLNACCIAFILVAWAETLTFFTYQTLIPLVCVCSICSAAIIYLCSLAFPILLSGVLILIPVASGVCLFLVKRKLEMEESGSKRRNRVTSCTKTPFRAALTADSNFFTFEPIEAASLHETPWMLLVVLCLSTLFTCIFNGLALHPYLANSQTTITFAFAGEIICLILIGCAGVVFLSFCNKNKKEHGENHSKDPLLLLQAMAAGILVVLVGGLLLFSFQLPHTMTIALALTCIAKNCLIVLCWILFPRAVADARLPFIPCFALLCLGSGMFYGSYLGVYISKSISMSFSTLVSSSTALLAFVAVLAIAYMVIRMRQISNQQRITPIEASEVPSLEDIRQALRAHQIALMSPYNLTKREQEIVLMIIDGQTLGHIGEELFISESTVKYHSKNAYKKLGVNNKKELLQMFSDL